MPSLLYVTELRRVFRGTIFASIFFLSTVKWDKNVQPLLQKAAGAKNRSHDFAHSYYGIPM